MAKRKNLYAFVCTWICTGLCGFREKHRIYTRFTRFGGKDTPVSGYMEKEGEGMLRKKSALKK